jgi:hypothetical protein
MKAVLLFAVNCQCALSIMNFVQLLKNCTEDQEKEIVNGERSSVASGCGRYLEKIGKCPSYLPGTKSDVTLTSWDLKTLPKIN